ncbi:hypothetical protein [Marinilabilia sp.]|uniref:hypothetical protein n=1 Tax=Marinilabilia sp. TaxID=2021252 RepID=UPI0025C63B79|nr:hypothetical protein [Marinilabilia sp.]
MNGVKKKEIGSVFHAAKFSPDDGLSLPEKAYYYGCGRYAINALLQYHIDKKEWFRLFIPEYFCYDVIDSIKETGIQVVLYPDFPLADDLEVIKKIHFYPGDVLLRMNYFGWRTFRDNTNLNVVVIEDHSHALDSEWAKRSNADWCFASLRKSIPIPDGGILWSPKNYLSRISEPEISAPHAKLSNQRFRGMELKSNYLESGDPFLKEEFLEIFNSTESETGKGEISAISAISRKILKSIPSYLNQRKIENVQFLLQHLTPNRCKVLQPDGQLSDFSLILFFDDTTCRDWVREELIKENIYPGILWEVRDDNISMRVKDFSRRMLSLPIDFRYSREDLLWMSKVVNSKMIQL